MLKLCWHPFRGLNRASSVPLQALCTHYAYSAPLPAALCKAGLLSLLRSELRCCLLRDPLPEQPTDQTETNQTSPALTPALPSSLSGHWVSSTSHHLLPNLIVSGLFVFLIIPYLPPLLKWKLSQLLSTQILLQHLLCAGPWRLRSAGATESHAPRVPNSCRGKPVRGSIHKAEEAEENQSEGISKVIPEPGRVLKKMK